MSIQIDSSRAGSASTRPRPAIKLGNAGHLVREQLMDSKTIDNAFAFGERCTGCGIRNLVLFADLKQEDFEHIHQPIDDLRFGNGEQLYSAGNPASHIFTIRSGLVKLVQYLPDGTQRIVRLLKSGDVTGLEGIIDQTYQHTAVALAPVEVCRIPVAVVQKLAKETTNIHEQLMTRWAKAVTVADAWLTELSTGTAKERVARLLLRLDSCLDGGPFQLLGREDVGATLGITTETASRVIAEFKRQGYIKQLRPNLVQIEIEPLQAIAEGDV